MDIIIRYEVTWATLKVQSYPQLELRGFSVPLDFLSFCFSYPRNWKSFFCHRCVVEV